MMSDRPPLITLDDDLALLVVATGEDLDRKEAARHAVQGQC